MAKLTNVPERSLSIAEAAAGVGTVQRGIVTDCYLDRMQTEPGEHSLELELVFDETKMVLEFDVETTDPPRGYPPCRQADVSVWARTVVLFCQFAQCLVVDHFVSTVEPRSELPPPWPEWSTGKYNVEKRVLLKSGWKQPQGPGEGPASRRQSMCELRSEALRTAVAAADEWILAVSCAARSVQEEIDSEQAVKVLSGDGLANEPARVPV